MTIFEMFMSTNISKCMDLHPNVLIFNWVLSDGCPNASNIDEKKEGCLKNKKN